MLKCTEPSLKHLAMIAGLDHYLRLNLLSFFPVFMSADRGPLRGSLVNIHFFEQTASSNLHFDGVLLPGDCIVIVDARLFDFVGCHASPHEPPFFSCSVANIFCLLITTYFGKLDSSSAHSPLFSTSTSKEKMHIPHN